MTTSTENAIVRDLATQAAEPKLLEPGKVYGLPDADGGISVVDTYEYTESPRRTEGNRTVRDVRSFLEYLDKHALEQTEVWADTEKSTVVAVIDAHRGAEKLAGFGRHRITLELVHTEEWKTWLGLNEKELPQRNFANHIEENALDIIEPTSATFLEIAQTLQGAVNVDWKNAERLTDGQTTLHYEETVSAKAGTKGDVEVPTTFRIAIKPYVGGPTYAITARLRFNPRGGQLTLTYLLDRPHAVLENAFTDIVNELRFGIDSEKVVLVEGGDGVVGKELELPAVPGTSPILFGKP